MLDFPPDKQNEMQKNAREKVQNNFTVETMVDHYLNLYKTMLES